MATQGDYLHGESQLVPNSLRVYRHFFVATHDELALRDNLGLVVGRRTEPRSKPKLISMNGRDASYTEGGPGPFAADCKRSNSIFPIGGPAFPDKRPVGEHKTPHVNCTCGFYAHYDPTTDFYPEMGWSLNPEAPAHIWDMDTLASVLPVTYVEPHIIVRAVVETSGTVVMGSRGVRAEKMKITAMAVDWDKFISVREVMVRDPIEITSFYDPSPSYLVNERIERRLVATEPTDTDRMRAEEAVKAVAIEAGAEFYVDAQQMYRHHPMPDLSSLGIEPAPPQVSWNDTWSNAVQQMRTSFQQQQTVFQATAQEMQKLLDSINRATGAVKKATRRHKPGGTMPDFYQRALEKKQNKPAPPGSGIDRRKKKP